MGRTKGYPPRDDEEPGLFAAIWSKLWTLLVLGAIVCVLGFVFHVAWKDVSARHALNGRAVIHKPTGLEGVIVSTSSAHRVQVRIYHDFRGFYVETFWIRELELVDAPPEIEE